MAIQSTFYTGTALEARTFPSTKHIATKQHMAVWRQEIAAPQNWVQMDITDYQLINNACVLNTLLSTTLYSDLEVRVADAPDELVSSPSDITIVAGIEAEIVTVAGIADEVVTVAGDSANVNLVGDDLALGIGTNQPTDSAILNALTNADIAIAKAAEALTSANNSATSETNSQLSEWESEASRRTSDSYATEAHGNPVQIHTSDGDGTYTATDTSPIEYSALHWSTEAATFNPASYALLTGATFTGQVKGIAPVAVEDLTRKDYVDDLTVHKSNVDQTKIGSLTIGESITVINWEYVTTTITLTVASHNAKVGDSIYVGGLVADIGDAPNETATVTSVTSTTIVYTASFTPTATADTGTTVSSATVRYGELRHLGGSLIGLGQEQTLQDLTASRTIGSIYTNTSGKPIAIAIKLLNTASVYQAITLEVDGITVDKAESLSDNHSKFVQWIVPNGITYKVINNTGGGDSMSWIELR